MHKYVRLDVSAQGLANELIEVIATLSNGDARVALQTVRAAAMSADAKRRDIITIDGVKEAINGARKSKLEYEKSKLNQHQRFLMDEIGRNKEIDSGELFRKYQDSLHDPVGERAYRNQMEQLVQSGLVREAGEGRWKKFQSH